MNQIKVTRQSSCGSLGLPPDLSCQYCQPSIIKALQTGTVPRKIKKCRRPWLPKWGMHRELAKVRVYKTVIEFLGEIDLESDTLEYHCINSKITKNTNDVNGNSLVSLNVSTTESETINSDAVSHNISTPQDHIELENSSSSIQYNEVKGDVSEKDSLSDSNNKPLPLL